MRLEAHLRGHANQDLVQGFPGIKNSHPRIEGFVEIKDTAPLTSGKPPAFSILSITIGVYRTDTIHAPNRMSSIKRESCSLVTRQKKIYEGNQQASCYGACIPFTLSFIPTSSPTASISLNKQVNSIYTVFITTNFFDFQTQAAYTFTSKHPLRLKKFDTLPAFRIYQQPVANEFNSSDYLCALSYQINQTAFGQGDIIHALIQLVPNPDWPKSQKVKLKKLSLELVQITKFFIDHPVANNGSSDAASELAPTDGTTEIEVIEVRNKLCKEETSFSASKQTKKEGIDSPVELSLVVSSPLDMYAENGVLPKESPEVGYEGKVPFTNKCSVYSVEFVLVFKAKLQNGKDIEGEQPVIISQFSKSAQVHYMRQLMHQANNLPALGQPELFAEPSDGHILLA